MRAITWAVLLFCTMATPAFAEVMDKMPTIDEVWKSSLPWSVIALILGRLHPALGLLLVFSGFPMLENVLHPHMGQAIRYEAGSSYVAQVYAANALIVLCYLCGIFCWKHSQRCRPAKLLKISILLFACLPLPTHAADPYKSRAEAVTNYVQTHFYNTPLKLYRPEFPISPKDPRADYAWGAGVWLTALDSAAKSNPKEWRLKLEDFADGLEKYWDANAPVPGYNANPDGSSDKYYDDNAWLVLGALEAYDVTREKRFLTRAKEAQNFVLSGWDARRGGGICWRTDRKSKNTCSNAPAAAAALRLYQITGDKTQLAWARTILTWLKANLQDPSDGLYWDNVNASSGEIGRAKFTYNTALVIRANALLFQLTGDKAALAEAQKVADSALRHWADPTTGRFGDDALFNHLLAESLLTLSRTDHDPRWREAVIRHADWTFSHLRDPSDGGYFAKPDHAPDARKTLINNAAIARLYWLLAQ